MASMTYKLQGLLRDIDPDLIREHLHRLDRRYFQSFTEDKIAEHIRVLSRLSPGRPVETLVQKTENGMIECTILAFDYPSEFSLISGVLSSMGFDTLFGNVFTYSAAAQASSGSRRFIIDCFTGKVAPAQWSERWAEELSERLGSVILLLEQGGKDSLYRTKLTVNEMAARALGKIVPEASAVLFPVQIDVDTSPPACTRMRVVSQDTPFFLFAFSTALSLQGVSIEHVTIRTEGGRIEDVFEFVDVSGAKIEDPGRIDRIKLSVLLTKQFTSFLKGAPDPLAALLRFETLVRDILPLPQKGMWYELLSNQNVLADLAQLLGASTFLWEDFIRLQYETLIPMLSPHVQGKSFTEPLELLPERIELALAGAQNDAEFERGLNEFKDKEIFLFDLDHILTPGSDFLELSRRLTTLAELIVEYAAAHAFRSLSRRFGTPMTVGGIPAAYAIMGLGKMGGAALGYASDIELLFVYSDSGSTNGPEVLDNSEFFDRLVRETQRLVHAKREGIFHVDLRLRPYGAAGPLACSLESFCTYYAKAGPAQAYERLSLVRLRAVGGDRRLGGRVERLRDEMIYSAGAIDFAELRALREKQMREKTRPGQLAGGAGRAETAAGAPQMPRDSAAVLNAKFSPGALVDLEYAVQVLQVTYGAEDPRLRTPKIHEALDALASAGILEKAQADELIAAYHFFRRLINGLRMLRGSARDLFLPAVDSMEYGHLARRTGYEPDPEMSPAQKLHLDFETHTAEVRAFVEKRFGRESLPGRPPANVADVILSDSIPDERAKAVLAAKGFQNPARALVNLRNLSGGSPRDRNRGSLSGGGSGDGTRGQRSLFARLAILACDILAQKPDPDMALNNWERFLQALSDPRAHFSGMLSQPMRLEILLSIFSASQFLADTLIRDPELLDYIGRPEILHARSSPATIASELRGLSDRAADHAAWLAALRKYRGREILRIGARDVCMATPTETIMDELSCLADGIVEAALARVRAESFTRRGGGEAGPGFCVIAFG
jgi:glutamate-ammonia-ligase adenylyltransferase